MASRPVWQLSNLNRTTIIFHELQLQHISEFLPFSLRVCPQDASKPCVPKQTIQSLQAVLIRRSLLDFLQWDLRISAAMVKVLRDAALNRTVELLEFLFAHRPLEVDVYAIEDFADRETWWN